MKPTIDEELARLARGTDGISASAGFVGRVMAAVDTARPNDHLGPNVDRSWKVVLPLALAAAFASLFWARTAEERYDIAIAVSDTLPVGALRAALFEEGDW